jgi:hypothetical protein
MSPLSTRPKVRRPLARTLLLSAGLLLSAAIPAPGPEAAEDRDEVARALETRASALPPFEGEAAAAAPSDWLVLPVERKAGLYRGPGPREITLANGLVRRSFRLVPNGATVALENLSTHASLIRAVEPEALLSLDGKSHPVGGLVGQRNRAYIRPEVLDRLEADPGAFRLVDFASGPTRAPFAWKRKRHSEDLPWPAPGVSLTLSFESPDLALRGLRVEVTHELYDGLPAFSKRLSVANRTERELRIDSFRSDVLAVAEIESIVDDYDPAAWRKPWITLTSDYTFGGMALANGNKTTVWLADPAYGQQVNYNLKTPALLVSRPPIGPAAAVRPGETFDSFTSFLVLHDSDARERQGMALRRVYRALAPWCTENPLMMHVRSADTATFRAAVDQCVEVGFEMIIYTFGSGLDMENVDPAYLARVKADVDYAHAKGIEVGAYSLLASRRVSEEDDVVNPATGKTGGAIFGNSPCLMSRWGEEYFRKIRHFIEATGLDLLEHDGSYPGDLCASSKHPGHRGLEDSQWTQWKRITDLYRWCRERGVFLNVPDHYFFNGANKTGMGYRETNWSLPREEQVITGRQNIYDGTWEKTPSMGWMFVPLTEYQGGGAAATIEPLSEHLDAYEAHLANNLGAGVQACWRGPRLYDTESTKALVAKWVAWFKEYRDILESDIVHIRRADGRDLDGFLHVNPRLRTKGLALIYNPLETKQARTWTLPVRLTGLSGTARVRERGGKEMVLPIDSRFRIEAPIEVPARGMTWLTIE